jgi:hypothetical protein
MSAKGALLRYVRFVIEIDSPVRARLDAKTVSPALLGVDDYYPVVPLVDGVFPAGLEAGGIVAMLADIVQVAHPYLRRRSPDHIGHLVPEVAGIRLRFGIGRPVNADVLILAGNLAVVTTVALINIYN